MWKGFIYTLLVEICLFGMGLLTVPDWLAENVSVWLPIALTILLVMLCWENWPKWMQVSRGLYWADMDRGGRYYRDLLVELKMADEVKMFDSMSSPVHPTKYPVAAAFR